MLRITHIITGLNTGGAENMLYKLLRQQHGHGYDCSVISLLPPGPVAQRIEALGVPVHSLQMRRGLPGPRALLRLVRLLRAQRPQIVQTWMYHADLLGGLAAQLARRPPVIWSIRQSDLSPRHQKRATLLTIRACARLSHWLPQRVVSNSTAGRDAHVAFGYAAAPMRVIPNGFDTDLHRPDAGAGNRLREALGLSTDNCLIGMVARFHAQKDHETFARAAGLLARSHPDARFVLCGDDIDAGNQTLVGWLQREGVAERVHLLGRRSDIAHLNAAFDIATLSSSFGEGFPNIIGEAMACGTPCVATDIGDSRKIIADTGITVPASDPAALAAAWARLIDAGREERQRLGNAARERMLQHYSLKAVAESFEHLYAGLATSAKQTTA